MDSASEGILMTTPEGESRLGDLQLQAVTPTDAGCACAPLDGISVADSDKRASYDPPTPRYEVTLDPDLRIPMRDGVELATDIYRPLGLSVELPTILLRTPYGKAPYRTGEANRVAALIFAGQGFAVAVQDVRGLFDSGGSFSVSEFDMTDGYDTLSWIASQPWSNGRVGTYGCSALGINQVQLAQTCHPAHACAIAQGSGGATASAGNRHRLADMKLGGAVEIGYYIPWFHKYCAKDHSRPEPKTDDEYARAIASLPVIDALKQLDSSPTDYEDWISRDPADPWFEQIGYLSEDSVIDTPTLFVNSWYDVGAADALHQRRVFRAGARTTQTSRHQHIILSPATHCATERTILGDRELGDARIDAWQTYVDWFDCWLNERPERIQHLPQVQYYVMGRNEWRSAPEWPPPGVELRRWYLRSGGNANTRLGDGSLSIEPPTAHEPADTFTYDPGDPFPSVSGFDGPRDHQEVQLRQDVLCFTSEPLEEGLEVTGFIKAVFYLSSSAPDTDLVAVLQDVHPDGRAFDVVDGILRARYREGFDREVMMEPGKVYRIEVDLDASSNWFVPGHRIRLQIASSAFPRFDRNLNTGGNNYDETEWAVAHNTVHHSSKLPSYVLLPIFSERL